MPAASREPLPAGPPRLEYGRCGSLTIQYSKAAVKAISSMEHKTKQRIKQAIENIPAGDIKPLTGYAGYYRLRVGGWRIIFNYSGSDTLLIDKIAPRGGAYKRGF